MRFVWANKIFNGEHFLPDNTVLVLNSNNVLHDFTTLDNISTNNCEKHEGIICPGFINTHCHLELSHMKGLIPQKTGLVDFVKNIISKRNSIPEEEQINCMLEADRSMREFGIAAVGDISNTNLSFEVKQKSKVYYHTFVELIGLNPARKKEISEIGKDLLRELEQKKLAGSLAAHAPYSTSSELIELIAEFDDLANKPFSIHNQESKEEDAFLKGEHSDFHQLFAFLKIDISWFKPSFSNSLESYARYLKENKVILVHNTFSNYSEITFSKANLFPCICPNANLYIEDVLPDFKQLLQYNSNICFGTDSLASNTALDVLQEANLFYSQTQELECTLRGLTSNGARALGIENQFGFLHTNQSIGINLLEDNKGQLILKAIISDSAVS